MKKNGSIVVLIIMILLVVLFVAIKVMSNVRETTKQDYLYYESSTGLFHNAHYEIGSLQNSHKQEVNSSGKLHSLVYNQLDDKIYALKENGCKVSILSRDGIEEKLNYCKFKNLSGGYGIESITFDKKNYKYLILPNGFGPKYRKGSSIAIFNDKKEFIKVINSDLYISSLVILNNKLVYTETDLYGSDSNSVDYLTTYDLTTNKRTRTNYLNKVEVQTLLQLDNDYLMAYRKDDGYTYVVTSKGKVISKLRHSITSIDPSHLVGGKWYREMYEYLIEYTKDSFKIIKTEDRCDRYNPLMFNNKSIYCIDKKDNKKIISVLNNDKNVYHLDTKYEYGSYHGLALFGFK